MRPVDMYDAVVRNLKDRTGKDLAGWIATLRKCRLEPYRERVEWLKREHCLGHVQASIVVAEADKPADWRPPSDRELLEAQYAGPKAALRALRDALFRAARKLGRDVAIEVRQTYVSLERRRQFATIKAAAKDRVELGLVLRSPAAHARLLPGKGAGGGRITHKVVLFSMRDLDARVRRWLADAYVLDAKP